MSTDEIPCAHCGDLVHHGFMEYHLLKQCIGTVPMMPVATSLKAAESPKGVPMSGKEAQRARRAKERLVKQLYVTVRKPGYGKSSK